MKKKWFSHGKVWLSSAQVLCEKSKLKRFGRRRGKAPNFVGLFLDVKLKAFFVACSVPFVIIFIFCFCEKCLWFLALLVL